MEVNSVKNRFCKNIRINLLKHSKIAAIIRAFNWNFQNSTHMTILYFKAAYSSNEEILYLIKMDFKWQIFRWLKLPKHGKTVCFDIFQNQNLSHHAELYFQQRFVILKLLNYFLNGIKYLKNISKKVSTQLNSHKWWFIWFKNLLYRGKGQSPRPLRSTSVCQC